MLTCVSYHANHDTTPFCLCFAHCAVRDCAADVLTEWTVRPVEAVLLQVARAFFAGQTQIAAVNVRFNTYLVRLSY